MGSWVSKMVSVFQSFVTAEGETARILMLGLDAAGKTTILYKIKFNKQIHAAIPTIGFNVETVEPVKGITFTVWDIGGQHKIRQMWKYYFKNTDALVYVVDSNDTSRFAEAREELHDVLDQAEMKNVPLVVLANKQDLPNAVSPSQLINKLSLRELPNKWHMQGTCAPKGEGLFESMEVLAQMVRESKINAKQ